MAQLRLALAQVNATVGDLAGNAEMVRLWTAKAAEAGAHLVAFPEMALTGYPVEDLALRTSFVDASRTALSRLAADLDADGLGDLPVVVGYLDRAAAGAVDTDPSRELPQNCAAVLHRGSVVARYAKHHLPNYGVFDEVARVRARARPGRGARPWRRRGPGHLRGHLAGGRAGVDGARGRRRAAAGPQRFAVRARQGRHPPRARGPPRGTGRVHPGLPQPGRRPGRAGLRRRLDRRRRRRQRAGARVRSSPRTCWCVDLDLRRSRRSTPPTSPRASCSTSVSERAGSPRMPREPAPERARASTRWARSTRRWSLGLRDYVRKNGFRRSSSACPAASTRRWWRPSPATRSAPTNVTASRCRASTPRSTPRTTPPTWPRGPGCTTATVPIEPMVEAFLGQPRADRGGRGEPAGPRAAGVILMGLSNQEGHLVLATGNKSELAVGLLHDLRRQRRRLRPDQGRAQDAGVAAGHAGATPRPRRAARRRRSRRARSPSRPRPSCGPGQARPGLPAALRDPRRDSRRATSSGAAGAGAARRRRLRPGDRRQGDPARRPRGVEAAPVRARARRSPPSRSAGTDDCRSPAAGASRTPESP